MDKHEAIKEVVEHDGRFRLVKLGHFYVDPERDFMEGQEPIFGAILKGNIGAGEESPAIVVPLVEEFLNEDPEIVGRFLVSVAEETAADILAD